MLVVLVTIVIITDITDILSELTTIISCYQACSNSAYVRRDVR